MIRSLIQRSYNYKVKVKTLSPVQRWITIEPVSRPQLSHKSKFGAIVLDYFYTNSVPEQKQIVDALLEYKVLIFLNQQNLSIEDQRKFTSLFGKLQIHSDASTRIPGYLDVNVVTNLKTSDGRPLGFYGKTNQSFHTDMSWYVDKF